MKVLPMGAHAVLLDELSHDPADWARGLRALEPDGVVEIVPAVGTVLVTAESAGALRRLVDLFERVGSVAGEDDDRTRVEIPVTYDGPDLDEVARAVGLSPDDVIALHRGADYEVAFCGFAPGFGYLKGLPSRLHLPRRPTPRTSVPAGSVAIASEFTAVYPSSSPGGWHLIGSTDTVMFDVDREPPSRLAPGDLVRFVAS